MFAIHGEWKISVVENYVLQWFSGCWNEEAAIAYTTEFREKTEHLANTQWCILSIFEEWESGVPAIESHIAKHCQRFKDIGCIKDCHIYAKSAFKAMQLEHLIPQSEGDYERQVFTDVDDAIIWLKKCGFNIEVAPFLNEINQ